MKLIPLLTLPLTLSAFADTTHWEFSENTAGENLHWVSPTTVDPNASQCEYHYEITYVAVDIIFLGQVVGPNDVTDQMDPELLSDSDGDIDVSADFLMQLNGNGYGEFNATNLFLGDVYVDTGWPFGWQYVDIDRIYMDGYMDITPFINACPSDIDGDGSVNDILSVISDWGGSGAGDVDGSGTVDITDLLAVVSAWGSCIS